MYTYTLRVVTSDQYHARNNNSPLASKFYVEPSWNYQLIEYSRPAELASKFLLESYIYKVHLVYFTDSENVMYYLKLNKATNPLKQTRKLARYRIRCIEKKIEMKSKGYVVGGGRGKE